MNILLIVLFIVWLVVLSHQRRRHVRELASVYAQIGKPFPPFKPRLTSTEAWLNIVLGCGLLLLSIATIPAMFAINSSESWKAMTLFNTIFWGSVTVAFGLSGITVGIRSVLYYKRHHR